MRVFERFVRAGLLCALVVAALLGGNAWAELTEAQADALKTQAAAGDKAALETLKSEAQQGNAAAQFNLGLMYANKGQGVPQDYAQAVQWYRKAAEQGDADAQNNLGAMYANGQGVPQSKVVAYALCNLSAALDSSKNNKATGNRSSLADEMTNQEIEAGRR